MFYFSEPDPVPSMDASVPFAIFDENTSQSSAENAPKTPFAIFDENAGQPNTNKVSKAPFPIFDENASKRTSPTSSKSTFSVYDENSAVQNVNEKSAAPFVIHEDKENAAHPVTAGATRASFPIYNENEERDAHIGGAGKAPFTIFREELNDMTEEQPKGRGVGHSGHVKYVC